MKGILFAPGASLTLKGGMKLPIIQQILKPTNTSRAFHVETT